MTEMINAGWMYAFVAVIIIGILVQNFIMMKKAWNHAKNDLKLDNGQIRKGLINGMGDGTLAPKEISTRAQVAQLIMNYGKKIS